MKLFHLEILCLFLITNSEEFYRVFYKSRQTRQIIDNPGL